MRFVAMHAGNDGSSRNAPSSPPVLLLLTALLTSASESECRRMHGGARVCGATSCGRPSESTTSGRGNVVPAATAELDDDVQAWRAAMASWW